MEPGDIPEITPPTLLALSTGEFKSSQSNCGLSMHMHIFHHHPSLPPSTASASRAFTVSVWDGGALDAVLEVLCALRCTLPVTCKE